MKYINCMECELCNKKLSPLDAHFGKMNEKLIVAHIDCWNKEIEKQIKHEF